MPFKKTAITVGIFAALVILAVWVLPLFQPTDGYRAGLEQAFKNATGTELEIRGGVNVSILPPQIVFNDVRAKNPLTSGRADMLLSAEAIIVHIPVTSLFASTPKLRTVTLVSPQINFESSGGRNNWDALAGTAFDGQVHFRNAQITFFDAAHAKDEKITGLNARADISAGAVSLEGSGNWRDVLYSFSVARDNSLLAFSLASTGSSLSYNGKKIAASEYQGEVTFSATNARQWARGFSSLNILPARFADVLLPEKALALKGVLTVTPDTLTLANSIIESESIQGGMDAALALGQAPSLTAALRLKSLDIDAFFPAHTDNVTEKLLPATLPIKFSIDAEKATVFAQPLTRLSVSGEISQGDMVISQAKGILAGNSAVHTLGILRESDRGAVYEGAFEVAGDDFYAAFTSLAGSLPLPAEHLKKYQAKARLFVSAKEMRLSEAVLSLPETQMSGAVIYDVSASNIAAALRINDINLDHYLDAFRPYAKAHEEGAIESPIRAWFKPYWAWMKKVNHSLRVNVEVEKFTLAGVDTNSARLLFLHNKGLFTAQDMDIWYNRQPIRGMLSADVKGVTPFVKGALALGEANTSLLTLGGKAASGKSSTDNKWSQTQFAFSLLDLINGEFNLRIRALKHNDTVIEDALLAATIQDAVLKVSSLTGKIWGGNGAAEIQLSGGQLPAFTASFGLSGINIIPIMSGIAGLDNIKGQANITGAVGASGLHMLSWMSVLRGNLRVSTQDVVVTGFDLPAMVRAVSEARNVADIINVSRLALAGGLTQFTKVEGLIDIEKGILTTGGLQLLSDWAEGRVLTRIDLPQWSMDTNIDFLMDSLPDKNIPSISLKLVGPINNPRHTLDTKHLEEYVTERTARHLVDTPPSQSQ